jgi:hypothetical protein
MRRGPGSEQPVHEHRIIVPERRTIVESWEIIETLRDRIVGGVAPERIADPFSDGALVKINEDTASEAGAGIEKVKPHSAAYNGPVQRGSVQLLFRALHEHGVRYLVAGGLAVVAHGYVRFTADVDLVLEMDARNLRAAVDALRALGYRPRAPVSLDDFLDPVMRAEWVRDKGMTVFSLYSPAHVATEVDVFVEMPFDFPAAYTRRTTQEIEADLPVTFVGLDDLLAMKRRAGRAQDGLDIERLEQINRAPDDV